MEWPRVKRRTLFPSSTSLSRSSLFEAGAHCSTPTWLRCTGSRPSDFNEQVKRNLARFPADFAFQLSEEEAESLRSQFATLKNSGRGQHRKYLPYVFTEHGAIMAAMILNSARAVEMSVYVVRAFVQLRVLLASNSELAQRVTKLERGHESHDSAIVGILKTLHEMQVVPQTRAIGFVESDEKKK